MNNTPLIVQTKIIEPMMFANYPKHGIVFLLGLGNTPLGCNQYVMEPKKNLIYRKKSITNPLCNYEHKQYPSSLD
jgi:hypothetical protein